MDAHQLMKSAQSTAKEFYDKTPWEMPGRDWLADMASFNGVPDERCEEWAESVRDEVRALQRLDA
jgi:hypothetical protein